MSPDYSFISLFVMRSVMLYNEPEKDSETMYG
jgi:hypothetical protein